MHFTKKQSGLKKSNAADVNFRFRNFINALYAFLQNGDDGERRYMSYDEKEKMINEKEYKK